MLILILMGVIFVISVVLATNELAVIHNRYDAEDMEDTEEENDGTESTIGKDNEV
jgi:hypothetical protein